MAVPRHGPAAGDVGAGRPLVQATHHTLGDYWLVCQGSPELLFTENEIERAAALGRAATERRYVKDGIHDAVVNGHKDAVNPDGVGTKVAAHYRARARRRRVDFRPTAPVQ